MKQQLDDAVVPERRQRNDLAGGSNNDPEGRVVQKFHSATGRLPAAYGRRLDVSFNITDAYFVIFKHSFNAF